MEQPDDGLLNTVGLDDVRALRAYAHPVRLRLVGLLRREGSLTATRAAELLGESSGTTSFHLRQLAKYGLVEEAGDRTGRQRPWRATARYTSIPDVATSTDMAEAATQLRTIVAQRYHEQLLDWIARRSAESEAWQSAGRMSDHLLYLTAAELAEVGSRIDALLERYADRTADPTLRPPDSRLLTYLNISIPAAPEPSG